MNIIYAGDSNVVKCAGVSLYSLYKNNEEVDEINVTFIEDDISEDEKDSLKKIAVAYDRNITFRSFNEIVEKLNIYDSRLPKSAYVRLFIEKLDMGKCLWLDCDTLVLDNIEDLWNTDIEDYWFAGVQDVVTKATRDRVETGSYKYINSGILLINCNALKQVTFSDKALQFIESYYSSHGTMIDYADQGVINATAKEKIRIVHPKYNVLSQLFLYSRDDLCEIFDLKDYYTVDDVETAKTHPYIIHFVAGNFGRPWQKLCSHPYKKLYREYMDKTIWRGQYDKNITPIRRRIDRYLYRILPLGIYKTIKQGYAKIK